MIMCVSPLLRNVSVSSDGCSVQGLLFLKECPVGYLLRNESYALQHCDRCDPGTYSINPLDGCMNGECGPRVCLPCPKGASCGGGSGFMGTPGEWEVVKNAEGYYQKRISKCPANFVLLRIPDQPSKDECALCEEVSACTRCDPEWPNIMTAADSLTGQQVCAKCSGCPDEITDITGACDGSLPTLALSVSLAIGAVISATVL